MQILTTSLLLLLMIIVTGCAFLDRRRRRAAALPCPVSVIVPCFNDGETVGDTLRSVFASWPEQLLEVVVIDDASTDDSSRRILDVARAFPIRVVSNTVNTGKSESLNRAVRAARHDLVLCLDADTLLTEEALRDMINRLVHDTRVGAVSCPYKPVNRGFLPAMQAIEYSMMRLGQGAGNLFSALALWGGCLMTRRAAFDEAGGFSRHAITEDVDLAFKLNRAGWRVEQSFVFVCTHVPTTWRVWLRQKMRWTSGGFQCVFAYPGVLLRNPVQMTFICTYAVLAMLCLYGAASEDSLFSIGRSLAGLWMHDVPFGALLDFMRLTHGADLVIRLVAGLGLNLVSLVYVIPTISRMREALRLALVLPFSMAYLPLYILVSMLGLGFWFTTLRRTPEGARAW